MEIVSVILSVTQKNNLSLSVAKTGTFSGRNFDGPSCPKDHITLELHDISFEHHHCDVRVRSSHIAGPAM